MNRLLSWPLPALLIWALAWAVYMALRGQHFIGAVVAAGVAVVVAAAVALALAAGLAVLTTQSPWRRLFIVVGFVLSMALSGHDPGSVMAVNPTASAQAVARELPAALWLLPLALLALIYPVQAWRDAPMFPTPLQALRGLAQATDLPSHARVLDAGCGLGDGMQALRLALPNARIEGVERSWPLRAVAGWRCGFARVRQGDMWRQSWRGLDLIYLFQRPESMGRAWAKAEAEMTEGAWLASLEFAVPEREPDAQLSLPNGKAVWLYRVGAPSPAQPAAPAADISRKTLVRPLGDRHFAR